MIKVKGKNGITATVVADSKSSVDNQRITTFLLEFHRFILPEFNTHRTFSRNSSSSRAVPVAKMLENVGNNPAIPVRWGKNQAGMRAEYSISKGDELTAETCWKSVLETSLGISKTLADIGVHKEISNRLTEPFQMIKVVVTATSFDNFFWLRFHEDAQPEIAELARCMLVAYKRSKPQELNPGEWHLPFVYSERYEDGLKYYQQDEDGQMFFIDTEDALKLSASCCAQVSYRKSDNSLEKAEIVWERLVASQPVHASPTEHQATPMKRAWAGEGGWQKGVTHSDISYDLWSNNFKGWIQHRALIANNVCNSYDYSQDVDENGLEITDEEEA